MIANMPTSSFMFFFVGFWLQFVFVVGYGIWWCLKDRNGKKNP